MPKNVNMVKYYSLLTCQMKPLRKCLGINYFLVQIKFPEFGPDEKITDFKGFGSGLQLLNPSILYWRFVSPQAQMDQASYCYNVSHLSPEDSSGM